MTDDPYEKITTLENAIEAQLISSILDDEGIAHRIRSYHDTAYDGLFQFQKGWGDLSAPSSMKQRINDIIRTVRSQSTGDED
jgi:hypothetical protein